MSNFRIIAIKTGANGISPSNFLKTSRTRSRGFEIRAQTNWNSKQL